MPNSDNSKTVNGRGETSEKHAGLGIVDYIKRRADERKAKYEKETPADKSARITARATNWIAGFTFILAICAAYQFRILNGQLDVLQSEQRAWINIVNVQEYITVGQPVITGIFFKNTGKTVAKNATGHFRAEILNATDEPTFDYSNHHLTASWGGHAAFPDAPMSLGVSALSEIPGNPTPQQIIWTQELADKYKNGQIWVATEGIISYDDITRENTV
jgi:hypothetical protein